MQSLFHPPGVLDPHGPVGHAERLILFDATVIMLAVFIPVMIATIWFAWWFRAGNANARYRPAWAYSGRLEFIVWSIPALVVLFLGGIGWVSSHDLDPAKPLSSKAASLDVQVVSLDWKWLFIYPGQGIASVNRLVLPVDVPVHFRLTSATVWNSFFVPELGSQIYAMAGMETQLNLLADRTGTYRGLSAQFSGDGFSDMAFDVEALPAAQFSQWIDGARVSGPTLDDAGYARLAMRSKAVRPFTYRDVETDLFHKIEEQWTPSAAPRQGPGASTEPSGGE